MADAIENKKLFSVNQIQEPSNIHDVVYNMMVDPNLAPVNYFNDFGEKGFELENLAGDDTDDAGVFTINNGLMMAMTTHVSHNYLKNDAKTATEILVSRAVRRMVCFGAKPKAVCAFLYQVNISDTGAQPIASDAKKGLENASAKFGLKISDRRISFDFSKEKNSSSPVLIVSLMGIVEDKEKVITHKLKAKGVNIFVIGRSYDDIGSSEYLEFYHDIHDSPLPVFNIDMEVKLQHAMAGLINKGLVSSASPVGKGGLFFSLLRAAMPVRLGFDITTDAEIRKDAFLFGESMGRIIVGVPKDKADDFVDFMRCVNLPFFTLGHATKGEIRIDDESFGFIDKIL